MLGTSPNNTEKADA